MSASRTTSELGLSSELSLIFLCMPSCCTLPFINVMSFPTVLMRRAWLVGLSPRSSPSKKKLLLYRFSILSVNNLCPAVKYNLFKSSFKCHRLSKRKRRKKNHLSLTYLWALWPWQKTLQRFFFSVTFTTGDVSVAKSRLSGCAAFLVFSSLV